MIDYEEEFDTDGNEEEEPEFDLEEYKNAFLFLKSKLQKDQESQEAYSEAEKLSVDLWKRYQKMSWRQFAQIISQIQRKGILNNFEEAYKL